jgi:hypothetical protein
MPLDQYADIIGLDPRHFNQMVTETFPDKRGAVSVFYQQRWMQPGKAARDDIARSIADAERMIANWLRIWPAPNFVESEVHPYPRGGSLPSTYGGLFCPEAVYGRRPTINLRWLYFIAGGMRRVDLLKEDVAVTYDDEDGDGWDEIATASLAVPSTSGWLPYEIAVFPAGSLSTAVQHQIRNLDISFLGGTIGIRGQAPWFVLPSLWDRRTFINGDDAAVFLDKVDVYRIYTYSSQGMPPVTFGWQSTDYATAFAESYGVIQPWESEKGIVSVQPAVWADPTWTVSNYFSSLRLPDLVKLNYLCGWPCDAQGRVDAPFARAIASLATARLTSPITGGGESVDGIYNYWQSYPVEPNNAQVGCPFGMQNGAWEAWRELNVFFATLEGSSFI